MTPNGLDTYDVMYRRIRGTKVVVLAESNGIYNEDLVADFERVTGLRVSLGSMGVRS